MRRNATGEGWQPIETFVPPTRLHARSVAVLLYDAWIDNVCIGYWSHDGLEWVTGHPNYHPQPTHWMPLPTRPGARAEPDAEPNKTTRLITLTEDE